MMELYMPLQSMIRLVFTSAISVVAPVVLAATLNERLHDFGHPNTTPCHLPNHTGGLGGLPVVQFERLETFNENDREAVALMKLLGPVLASSGLQYAGFDRREDWKICANADPQYVFWRDYDNNWRYVKGEPSRYFGGLLEGLTPELRGTPVEAYVLNALAAVEEQLRHQNRSVIHYEKAYAILEATDDPTGIKARVLAPLVHHYLGKKRDPVKGEVYLHAYALAMESFTGLKDKPLPLIKVAPVYPRRAWAGGRQGFVILEYTVDAEGRVLDPIVIEGSPEGLFEDAAIDAALQFRYVPKVVDGKRIPVSGVRNRITFELTF